MNKVIATVICLVLLLSLVGCGTKTVENGAPVAGESNMPNNSESIETGKTELTTTENAENDTADILFERENDYTDDLPPENVLKLDPRDEDFVRIQDYIPDLLVDLRYSTENNFTGERIYDFSEVWLRFGTVKKLKNVQETLKKDGKALKIWDGFRPTEAQFKLWEVCPNPTYVANPVRGFSSHSRGNTLDLTLADLDGAEVIMPSGFDDFSALADRDYSDCPAEAEKNATLLENTMVAYGFVPYKGEWWHYSDAETYPVEQSFTPVEEVWCYATCNEYISLRARPDVAAEVVLKIPASEKFKVHAKCGAFFYVEYLNNWGYVLSDYAKPIE